MNNDLILVETSLAEFDAVEAGLVELESKYKNVVFDVKTTKGMAEAVASRAEIRAPRINVEKIRKAGKAPILALGRLLDSKASEITARLEAIESPIDDQIKAEEQRKAAEKSERDRIEAERVARHQRVIDSIKTVPVGTAGRNSANIKFVLESLRNQDFSGLEEFVIFAENARTEVIKTLEGMHQAALEKEEREAQEAAARKAEQERLAEERRKIAEAQEELRKAQDQDRIRRNAENAEIERRKREQDAIELAARIKREEEEATHREAIKSANAKIEADRLALEKQKEAQEEAERISNHALINPAPIEPSTIKESLLVEEQEAPKTPIEEIVFLVKEFLKDEEFHKYVEANVFRKLSQAIEKYEATK